MSVPRSKCLLGFSGSEGNPWWHVPLAACDFTVFQNLCNVISLTLLQFVGQYHQDLLPDYVVFNVRALTGSSVFHPNACNRFQMKAVFSDIFENLVLISLNTVIFLTDDTSHPERESEKIKETRPGLQINHFQIPLWLLLGRINEAFAKLWLHSHVLTPAATPCFKGFIVKVTCVRDSQEDRCDNMPKTFLATWDCKAKKCVIDIVTWRFRDLNGATVVVTRYQAVP